MADVRLIDANALLEKECCGRISGEDVRKAPTINPDDCRPHGRWEFIVPKSEMIGYFECSRCHRNNGIWQSHYCPHCGAKMDGKEQGDV